MDENLKDSQKEEKPQGSETNPLLSGPTAFRSGPWLFYIIALSVFIAINVGMLVINSSDTDFIETVLLPFHLIEFWAVFFFTLLDLAIIYSKGMSSGNTFKDVIFAIISILNIVLTFIPAMMVSIALEHFEDQAHWIEYSAQIPIICVDLIFFSKPKKGEDHYAQKLFRFLFVIFLLIGSIVQLILFSHVADYNKEVYAHYCEFTLEGLNACVALYFCILVFMNKIPINK